MAETKNEVVPVNCRKISWWPPQSVLDIATDVEEEEQYKAFIKNRRFISHLLTFVP